MDAAIDVRRRWGREALWSRVRAHREDRERNQVEEEEVQVDPRNDVLTPMPETQAEGGDSSELPFPPWMIREGLDLTREQRGGMTPEEEAAERKDFEDYFLKIYHADLLNEQELAEKPNKQESAGDIQLATTSSDRHVGMKSKRKEEDVEWEEEAPVAAKGNYKLEMKMNVEA